MDTQSKKATITIIPVVVLLVFVGALTNYNLIYTIAAGIVGGLLGKILSNLIR